jgi:hypothetical protein
VTFGKLLTDAKTNTASQQQILEMYKPLLIKESIYDGVFDEDLYQELVEVLLRCIRTFSI